MFVCITANNYIDGNSGSCKTCVADKATKAISNGTACTCATNFVWNNQRFDCECKTGTYLTASTTCLPCTMTGAILGKSSNQQCLCNKDYVWNSDKYTCECPSDALYIFGTKKCIACNQMAGSTGINSLLKICTCDSTASFTWSVGLSKCICKLTQYIDSGNKCATC